MNIINLYKKYKKKITKFFRKIYNKFFKEFLEKNFKIIEFFGILLIYAYYIIRSCKNLINVLEYVPEFLNYFVPFPAKLYKFSLVSSSYGRRNYSVFFLGFITNPVQRGRLMFLHLSPKLRFHLLYNVLLDSVQCLVLEWIDMLLTDFTRIKIVDVDNIDSSVTTYAIINFLFFYGMYSYSIFMLFRNRFPFFKTKILSPLNVFADSTLMSARLGKIEEFKSGKLELNDKFEM